jgi:misacylated tRNA(Ala) deacylase
MSLYQPYHTDAYLKEIYAAVVAVEGDRVALDETVFYARGGGQPADRGTLSWDGGEARIVDVRREKGEAGGRIWHLLEGQTPPEGERVHGELDWERRHALMRAHTALHVLCGVIWRDYTASP